MVTIIKSRFTTNKFRTRKKNGQRGGAATAAPAPAPAPAPAAAAPAAAEKAQAAAAEKAAAAAAEKVEKEFTYRMNFLKTSGFQYKYEQIKTHISGIYNYSYEKLKGRIEKTGINIYEEVQEEYMKVPNVNIVEKFISVQDSITTKLNSDETIKKNSYISIFDLHGCCSPDLFNCIVPDNTMICFISPLDYSSRINYTEKNNKRNSLINYLHNMTPEQYISLFKNRNNIKEKQSGSFENFLRYPCFSHSSWFYPGQIYQNLELGVSYKDVKQSLTPNDFSCNFIEIEGDKVVSKKIKDADSNYTNEPFYTREEYITIFDTKEKEEEKSIRTDLKTFVNITRTDKKFKLVIVPCCRPLFGDNIGLDHFNVLYYDTLMYHINQPLINKTEQLASASAPAPEFNTLCNFESTKLYFLIVNKTINKVNPHRNNHNLSGIIPKVMFIYDKIVKQEDLTSADIMILLDLSLKKFILFIHKLGETEGKTKKNSVLITFLIEQLKKHNGVEKMICKYNYIFEKYSEALHNSVSNKYNYKTYEKTIIPKIQQILKLISRFSSEEIITSQIDSFLPVLAEIQEMYDPIGFRLNPKGEKDLQTVDYNYYKDKTYLTYYGSVFYYVILTDYTKLTSINFINPVTFNPYSLSDIFISNSIEELVFDCPFTISGLEEHMYLDSLLTLFKNLKHLVVEGLNNIPIKLIHTYHLEIETITINNSTFIEGHDSTLNNYTNMPYLKKLYLNNVSYVPENFVGSSLKELFITNPIFLKQINISGFSYLEHIELIGLPPNIPIKIDKTLTNLKIKECYSIDLTVTNITSDLNIENVMFSNNPFNKPLNIKNLFWKNNMLDYNVAILPNINTSFPNLQKIEIDKISINQTDIKSLLKRNVELILIT